MNTMFFIQVERESVEEAISVLMGNGARTIKKHTPHGNEYTTLGFDMVGILGPRTIGRFENIMNIARGNDIYINH